MKRILLALCIGIGVVTFATTTTSATGAPKKYNTFSGDTIPNRDTTKKKKRDTMSADIMVLPQH